MQKRLSHKYAIYTGLSGTTVLINYSKELKILEVEFTGGHIYHYFDVPLSKWNKYKTVIETGGSSGEYVNQQIKPFYKAEEIG
ncbi:MAG: KTSC domain-containing protein [Bacteroidota bacterium]|nr:KTSC domain-containing protein [Bacteroidota bacterium]